MLNYNYERERCCLFDDKEKAKSLTGRFINERRNLTSHAPDRERMAPMRRHRKSKVVAAGDAGR